MEKLIPEITYAIIISTIILIILVVFLLLFFLLFNKKKQQLFKEKILMQQQFQLELIKTQFEVQEKTRKHLAEELHDNIGQILSLTNVTLASVQLNDVNKAQQKITDAQALVAVSIKELRQLSKIIHGEQILQQGLIAAIEQELSWLKRNEQFTVSFNHAVENISSINTDKDLFIYRLLQECLNNIIKHAEATSITIQLKHENNQLLLQLTDNGKGFDINAALANKAGLGLHSMQKRTKLLNGTMTINSNPNQGTVIAFVIPY